MTAYIGVISAENLRESVFSDLAPAVEISFMLGAAGGSRGFNTFSIGRFVRSTS